MMEMIVFAVRMMMVDIEVMKLSGKNSYLPIILKVYDSHFE